MTKKILSLSLCLLGVAFSAVSDDAQDLLTRAKQAMAGLETVKSKGQTVTAGIDVIDEEAAIDYRNGSFYGIDRKNGSIVATTYCRQGIVYTNRAANNVWLQYPREIDFLHNVFDQSLFFASFPDDPAQKGFIVTFAGQAIVGGDRCLLVQSSIFDKSLAKSYITRSLDQFVPAAIAELLRQDEQMLEDYLEVYLQQPSVTLWISQDNSLIKKYEVYYQQIAGPQEALSIRRALEYYDFNRPLNIQVPDAALAAETIVLESMSF